MEINTLINSLAAEFEISDPSKLNAGTSFRGMKEWSSMHALIIIATVNAEYDVMISGNDLMELDTVQDLYDLIVSRKK
ncbi:MAG: acyl carrier protein [Bacteroidetes bacterium]|nr:acyl carrier protein [Bacteroidota bacterium]